MAQPPASSADYAVFYAEQMKGRDQLAPLRVVLTSSARASRPCVGAASYEGAVSLASVSGGGGGADIWALPPNGGEPMAALPAGGAAAPLGTLYVVVFPNDTSPTEIKTKLLETRAAIMGVRVAVMNATTQAPVDGEDGEDDGVEDGAGAGVVDGAGSAASS